MSATDTGTRIARPCVWRASALAPVPAPDVLIVRHPAGGWTHARRINDGAARVYVGNWPTARAAGRALGAR